MPCDDSNSPGPPKPEGFTDIVVTAGKILYRDYHLILLFLVPALALALSEFTVRFYHGQLLALASQMVPDMFINRIAFSPRMPFILTGLTASLTITFVAFCAVISISIQRADAVYQGKSLSLRVAASNVRYSIGQLMAYLLGSTLLVSLGTLLLVFPGIYLVVRLSAGAPAIVLDNGGARAAVRESWARTQGYETQIAGVLLTLVVGWLLIAALPVHGVPIAIAVLGAFASVSSTVIYRRSSGRPAMNR